MTTELCVETRRGTARESVHRVSVAVVNADGLLLAGSGNPDLVTYWRSSAKPIQVLPLVEGGGLERFGLGVEELALACASHSSEPVHRAVAGRFLERIGCTEGDLACGPNRPLGEAVAREVAREGTVMTPIWSTCSGKHAAMLALARHHGWETTGYHRAGHPVQDRILQSVVRWTDVPEAQVIQATDGCNTVCFALPLRNMALAYARVATSTTPAVVRVRDAMMAHPELVAGSGRPCTEIMQAMPGRVAVKIGAEGVYCAALVDAGLGVALKVEDGDMVVSPLALIEVLRQVYARSSALGFADALLPQYRQSRILNTRGEKTGVTAPVGHLTFAVG